MALDLKEYPGARTFVVYAGFGNVIANALTQADAIDSAVKYKAANPTEIVWVQATESTTIAVLSA
jgi:hypothetical protein